MANQGPDKMNQLIKTIIFRWFISNDPSIQYPLIQYWQYQGSTIHHPDTIQTLSNHLSIGGFHTSIQGGRSWQPFVHHKKSNKTFVERAFANFCDKKRSFHYFCDKKIFWVGSGWVSGFFIKYQVQRVLSGIEILIGYSQSISLISYTF